MRGPTPEQPAAPWVLALSGLAGMGPKRLGALLGRWSPAEAWNRVVDGRAGEDPQVRADAGPVREETWGRWAHAARSVDVDASWEAHRRAGVHVLVPGDAHFPDRLADDPEPPAILFVQGDLAVLTDRPSPAVAVVGTRHCSHVGRLVARQLGYDLARAGVRTVSGLALGIDGAAHDGVVTAVGERPDRGRPVGVVGSGLDQVYPRGNARLWADVASAGVLVSEYPLGTPPDRWRFPARNRLVAALADLLVVVESPRTGGSIHTVEAAIARGRTVLAVPGSVRNPAAAGTNDLLAAGCPMVRDVDDVLMVLGLEGKAPTASAEPAPTAGPAPAAAPTAADEVMVALAAEGATLEQVVVRTGLALASVARRLAELERAGAVTRVGGWYLPGR